VNDSESSARESAGVIYEETHGSSRFTFTVEVVSGEEGKRLALAQAVLSGACSCGQERLIRLIGRLTVRSKNGPARSHKPPRATRSPKGTRAICECSS
jgi:hypothetical protein